MRLKHLKVSEYERVKRYYQSLGHHLNGGPGRGEFLEILMKINAKPEIAIIIHQQLVAEWLGKNEIRRHLVQRPY